MHTDSFLEKIVNQAIGPSGFMEFTRFDLGEVVHKERGPAAPRSLRLVVGNPLIMKQMVERVPDAGSYAPVTILIDERPDGVHLSYDTMASFLTCPFRKLHPAWIRIVRQNHRCLQSCTRSECSSPTCSSRGAGMRLRICVSAISSRSLCGGHRLVFDCEAVIARCSYG